MALGTGCLDKTLYKNDNPARAHDGYPIHVVPYEDARVIFSALGKKTDMSRFRSQIMVSGLNFRQIHEYAELEVNGVTVIQPKPSDRCEVTGRDQQTGEFSDVKPLAGIVKLGAGRWIRPDNGKKVHIVGENWLPQGEVVLSLEDKITFTKLREKPLEIEESKPKS